MKIDAYIIDYRGRGNRYTPATILRQSKTTITVGYMASVTGSLIEKTFTLESRNGQGYTPPSKHSKLRERGNSGVYGPRLVFDLERYGEEAARCAMQAALAERYRAAAAKIDAAISHYGRDGSTADVVWVDMMERMAAVIPAEGLPADSPVRVALEADAAARKVIAESPIPA